MLLLLLLLVFYLLGSLHISSWLVNLVDRHNDGHVSSLQKNENACGIEQDEMCIACLESYGDDVDDCHDDGHVSNLHA
jgi:hypothetical protein